jgi:site-specific DNA-methyltransferase (adenine-specific)
MIDFGYYNMDCMDGMKEFPDGYFDLAIVDPPYGIGLQTMTFTKTGAIRDSRKMKSKRRDYRLTSGWDVRPTKEYFDELFRVSKKQIIWGGNYFNDYLYPSRSFVIWDKRESEKMNNDLADCEYAWLSSGMGVARIYRHLWSGMLQKDMKNKEDRFHPTQKPVALYEWLLNKYANPGDKILDTHVGSASSLVACEELGFKYVGFEIDPEYYAKGMERLENNRAQMSLFRNDLQEEVQGWEK